MNHIATVDLNSSLPAMIDRAAKSLAGARNAAEVLEAKEIAAVAYDMAKRAARLSKAKDAHDELIAKLHRAQADALEIEAGAKRRLADEYDAAQERGEVAKAGDNQHNKEVVPGGNDLGISRKDIHEARLIRDAEVAEPGIVKATIAKAIEAGDEPTRADVRRAVMRTVRPIEPLPPVRPARGKEAICQRVREAVIALSGLPAPHEVVGYLRGTDQAVLIDEHLRTAAQWLSEFTELWPEEATDA